MMKNEDLKRLLKEEKLVLKPDRILTKIAFISILFFSNITAQIPLNGFCRFQEFQTIPGYVNIFPYDFNRDGWRDLILFNDSEKRCSIQSWDKSNYSKPVRKTFSSALYALHPFGTNEAQERKFVYISRKQREVGFVSFSKYGSASFQSKMKLKSFPASIDVGDINDDGKLEILLSGGSFQGLSILREVKGKFVEGNIYPNSTFEYSAFIDLDYDGKADIAAVDLFTNSIMLFYNYGAGNFKESRSIELEEEIHGLKSVDVNSDDLTDLIFIKDYRFEVLVGDSVSSFNKKLHIDCEVTPDKYTIFDFNGDGYNDIAFINIETGSLYIIFAKSTTDFYPPILYLKRKGIIDLNSFVDSGGRKLCVLDTNGKVYLIDKVPDGTEEFSIALGAKPTLVGNFNFAGDDTYNFYFTDDEKKSLNVLLGSKRKVFYKYFSYPLSEVYTNIVVDETQSKDRTFFLYSQKQRIIELIRTDFVDGNFTRKVLYAHGPIEDLKLTNEKLKDRQTIMVLINEIGKLSLQTFDFKDFRYVSSGIDSIAVGVVNAALAFDLYKDIFNFSKKGHSLNLSKSVFDKKVQNAENINSINIEPGTSFDFEVKGFDGKDIHEKPAVAWLSKNLNTNLFLINNNNVKRISLQDFSPSKNFIRLFSSGNVRQLFLYDKKDGNVIKIFSRNNYRSYDLSTVFESKDINSYIVSKLNNKKEYFIYSDASDNLIKFKYIK